MVHNEPMFLLAPEVVIDLARPGRTVPHELFGTNLPARAQSTPDVIERFRRFGTRLYRYPGGGAPGWHWMTPHFDFGIGPSDDTCDLARLDNAFAFARATDGQLLYSVNLESGTTDEAAALASASAPEGVRDYEIGNEPFGDWDHGYRAASAYASDVAAFSRAIKAMQPNARVGAAMAGEYRDVDDDGDAIDTADWDRVVLRTAGAAIDFMSYHWYAGRRAAEEPMHVMAGSLRIPTDVARFQRLAAEAGRPLDLAYLEWDGVFDHDTTGARYSLANAIFTADALGQMATAGVAASANYEATTRSYGLIAAYDPCARPMWPAFDGVTVRPKALAIQLASGLAGGALLPVMVTGVDSYDATTTSPMQEYAGPVPYLSAYAAKVEGGVRVMLVHRAPDQPATVHLRLAGGQLGPGTAARLVLTGPSLSATNEGGGTAVQLTADTLPWPGGEGDVTIPPRSVVRVDLAEAPRPGADGPGPGSGGAPGAGGAAAGGAGGAGASGGGASGAGGTDRGGGGSGATTAPKGGCQGAPGAGSSPWALLLLAGGRRLRGLLRTRG